MKTYMGDRTIDGIVVTVDGEPLNDRRDVQTLTEDGFEWGFEGPAAAQLALALLADHLDDSGEAVRLHDAFMREIVANFANEWEMTSTDMAEAVDALRS
ncbi:MAG: DUF6166 domain-containing protein [Pseudomonadota bacterium]